MPKDISLARRIRGESVVTNEERRRFHVAAQATQAEPTQAKPAAKPEAVAEPAAESESESDTDSGDATPTQSV
jgi:hypothetical protein